MSVEQTPKSNPGFLRRYRRLLPYFKPARWYFAGGLLAGLVLGAASGVGLPMVLYVVAPVIFGETESPPTSPQSEISPAMPAQPVISSDSPNRAAVEAGPKPASTKPTATSDKTKQAQEEVAKLAQWLFGADYRDKLLLVACFAMPLIFLVRGASGFLNRYWINYAGFLTLEALRADVFRRLQQLPLAYYHRHKSGDLTSRLITDSEQLKTMVVAVSGDILTQPFTLLGALGTLTYLAIMNRSAVFVLITLVSVPLCIIPIRLAARRLIHRAYQLASQTGELTAVVTESLQSPMEVQAYNLQARLLDRFIMNVRSIFRLAMKAVKYQAIINPVIEFISACGFMVALYFGARYGMTFKVYSSMGLALYMAYDPVKKLSNLNSLLKIGSASLERLEQVLDAEDTVPQPAEPVALPGGPGDIVFDHVGFTYSTGEPDRAQIPALSDINICIRPGEVVALVGASGAGKSTFVALIPRFYDPTRGRVTLGGVELKLADKQALRERIAIVPQMPALFNTTIAENIRMGRSAATDAEVKLAAKNAFIADFIEGLPQGYETIVGERGTALSGGQRQRIAIARAFLKDAPILILDEAMSALDSESEAMIHDALLKLVQGRTTLMIAHRFSSIGLATRVLVFEEGRITGDGAPAVLSRSHTVYRRMSELQKLGEPPQTKTRLEWQPVGREFTPTSEKSMTTIPGVVVVGCGYWGKNLVRNFQQLGALRAVCDATETGRATAQKLAPGVRLLSSLEELLRLPDIAGVALATPAVTHFPLALQCLAAGRDLFVEKPLALRAEEGRQILEAARAAGRMLLVGHILEYHPAILALRKLIDSGKLGQIQYLYSNRLHFGKIRTEENALWSFAPHDVAVILRLVGAMPEEVSCRGAAFVHGHLADVTVSTLHFPKNIHAHIFVSWLNPFKEQKLVVVGTDRMAVFNDTVPQDKLLLYNQHVTVENGIPVLHNEDLEVVPIESGEPLAAECRDFLHCIATRTTPLSGGESGLRVLQVLEACQQSMDLHGRGVRLENITS